MTQIAVTTTGVALKGKNGILLEVDPFDYAKIVANGLRPMMEVAFGEQEVLPGWDLQYERDESRGIRLVVWTLLNGKWGWSIYDTYRNEHVESCQDKDLQDSPAPVMEAAEKRYKELHEKGKL
jgi:hypothetical protein